MEGLSEAHGILVVDKPAGPTSHDIVSKARRHFKTRRVGHTGTLDPMATGVLVLLVGEATKLSGVLGVDDKVYWARVTFGLSTNTDDALGVPIQRGSLDSRMLSRDRLECVLDVERERKHQLPPAFCAIKKGGQPMYRQARLGISVPIEPRPVTVHSLRLLDVGCDHVDLELHSSKGYYVRALARDLGQALNCPAHLSGLRRMRAGQFSLSQATQWPLTGNLKLTSIADAARVALPCYELTAIGVRRARLGQELTAEHFLQDMSEAPLRVDMAWLYEHQLVAIGRWNDTQTLRVKRGFNLGYVCHEPTTSCDSTDKVREVESERGNRPEFDTPESR